MLIAFLVATAALVAAPTPPAPAAQAATPDALALAEAVRFLEAEGFEEQVLTSSEMSIAASMAAMTDGLRKRFGDAVPGDLLEQLQQVMRDHAGAALRAKMTSLKLQAAQLYAQEFTSAELARLRELSADPVMVKARTRGKVLAPKLMMLGMKLMRDAQPELEVKINRLVAEYVASQRGKPTS